VSPNRLSSWHAQRHANDGVRVFSREWRAKGDEAGQEPRQTPLLTAEQAAAIRADDRTAAVVARQYGIGVRMVAEVRSGRVEGVPTSKPPCMTDEEWQTYTQGRDLPRRRAGNGAIQVITPCHDCLIGHALEMRAEGRCNGHPRGVEPDEDEPGEPGVCHCGHESGSHQRRSFGSRRVICRDCMHEGIAGYMHDYSTGLATPPAPEKEIRHMVKVTVNAPCESQLAEREQQQRAAGE
jgi:hypothetical protein